jgi:hypothetical protein
VRVEESVRLPSARRSQDRLLVERLASEIESIGRMEATRNLPLGSTNDAGMRLRYAGAKWEGAPVEELPILLQTRPLSARQSW